MGKPTGFLEYVRQDCPALPPEERVGCFDEFHTGLTAQQRRAQGARCMNCGVPFCQSAFGCPLHNLVPEWNEEIFAGNYRHALARLLKTNDFPEFTGRVCPALCENACVCSLNGDAVTVRENELAVVEYGWNAGLMSPVPPDVRTGKRVAVVGSGPAGLAAAAQLNRRGHSVTVFERDDRPGGLLMYGIPNMKLDKSVVERRVKKMAAEGIEFVCGAEIGKDVPADDLKRDYDAVILCCGARKAREPEYEGAPASGVVPALAYLAEATRAVLGGGESVYSAKGKHVVIIGNGDTATDCVATALRQGAKTVTQLVRRPKPEASVRVWPYAPAGEKTGYGQEEAKSLFGSDPRLYATTARRLLTDDAGALRAVTVRTNGREWEIPADLLLPAAGFSGAEPEPVAAFGLALDEKGRLGDGQFRTADPKVFACGDMRRGASLVVWAIAEGRACARAVDLALEGYTYL